ncbi:UxaA family hydrolase, partial [Blautia producta]|nr:UxaA family hydrolase [Blautia producta]
MQNYLKIHPDDSVAVALAPLAAGTSVHLDHKEILLSEDIPQGHKFALKDIRAGEAVIKYGSPIGQARVDIAQG